MSKPMYVWNGSTWEEVGPVVPQTPIAYQASAPSSPSTGDIWVDSDGDVGTFDRQLVRYRFVASGGETSLSGVDANGFTLAYVPGAEQVYLNGVLLVRTSDYTATNGTSITALSPALAANDVVEVFAYNSFNLANTYTKAEVDGSLDLKADVSANGLVHIDTVTGTGVSSLSLDGVFTSTYDVYKIFLNYIPSTSLELRFRYRASNADLTNTGYAGYQADLTSAWTITSNYSSANIADFSTSASENVSEFTILKPADASIGTNAYSTGVNARTMTVGGFRYSTAAAVDGFSFITSTGNFSTIRVRVFGVHQ